MRMNVGDEMECIFKEPLDTFSVIGLGALRQNAGDAIGQPRCITRINDPAGIQSSGIKIAQAIVGTIDQVVEANIATRLPFELITESVKRTVYLGSDVLSTIRILLD